MAKSFPNTGATVIDATADLPGSPSEGMMVFQKDTNELKIYDGASWVSMLDTDTPPALVYLSTSTFTNVASTTITNCFNTSYDNYKVFITCYGSDAAQQSGRLQIIDTSSTITAGYYYGTKYVRGGGVEGVLESGNSAATINAFTVPSAVSNITTSIVEITGTPNSRRAAMSYSFFNTAGDTYNCFGVGAALGSSNRTTGLVLSAAAGNITGTAVFYGYRNSI